MVLHFQAHEDPMYDIIRENKRNEKETRYEHSFFLSVLLPVKNHEDRLKAALRLLDHTCSVWPFSLSAQSWTDDLEILSRWLVLCAGSQQIVFDTGMFECDVGSLWSLTVGVCTRAEQRHMHIFACIAERLFKGQWHFEVSLVCPCHIHFGFFFEREPKQSDLSQLAF